MTGRSRVLGGYALVAVAASSWGTWPLILRAAEKIAPMPAALESVIMMAVLMAVSAPFAARDRVLQRATTRDWLGIAWLGVADAMNAVLFFAAYQKTSVAIAVLTHYLTPIFVALAAPIFLHEKVGSRTYGAVAIAFAGLVLLLAPWSAAGRATDLAGAALGAGSAIFYASNVIATKRLTAFSASELMFFHGFIAVPLLAALVPHSAWGAIDGRALAIMLVGSLGPGAFAGLFFVWGLRRVRASHASTLTLLEPLVAVIVGAVAFGERLDRVSLAGGALILVGAVLVVASRSQTIVDA